MSIIKIINARDGIAYSDTAGTSSTDDNFVSSELTNATQAFWGVLPERWFSIPFWKAKELIQNSNLKQLALKVKNFNDNEKVSAEWVSFNAEVPKELVSNIPTVNDIASQLQTYANNMVTNDLAYFVFGETLMETFRAGFGGIRPRPPVQTRVISARLGNILSNGEEILVAYFILGEIKAHFGAGTGGPSLACGAKFPPKT